MHTRTLSQPFATVHSPEDDEFVGRFEACELEDFPHASHVRLACLYLDRHGEADTLGLLLRGLKRFAAAKGQPGRFHHTMTRGWLELIIMARRSHPHARTVDALMAACPLLADGRALTRYYSEAVLWSAKAREDWVPPDRAAFGATV
jgi:hypothetical protein